MDAVRTPIENLLPIELSEVLVRTIQPYERNCWDALMRRLHYLGFSRTAGRALRQVAEYQRRWLALLCWQARAPMCAPRDRRVLQQADPDALERAFGDWVQPSSPLE